MIKVFINGKEVSFEERFPDIEELKVEITQFGNNVSGNVGVLNKETLGITEPCSNHLCEKGGFEINTFISKMYHKRETSKEAIINCKGYEKMGGRKTRKCLNYLGVNAEIKYKSSESDKILKNNHEKSGSRT